MLQWHHKLEACQDGDQLLDVARDFLASWEPEDLAKVPSRARPTQVKGTDDIAYWHQRLVDCYVTSAAKGTGTEEVRGMLHFFSLAMHRASELRAIPPVGEHEAAARLFSDHSVPRLFTSALTGSGEP